MTRTKQAGSAQSASVTSAGAGTKTVNVRLQFAKDHPPLESLYDVNLPLHFTRTKVEPIYDRHDKIGQTFRFIDAL